MQIFQKTFLAVVSPLVLASIAGSTLVHAQGTTASGTTPSSDSIVAIAADSQSLPQVAPSSVPVRGGTFWWVYPGGLAVPAPVLPLDSSAPIYSITPGVFLVDLTGGTVSVPPYQLKEQAQLTSSPYAAAVTAQVQGLIDIITMVQTPATTSTTATTMTLSAKPMDLPLDLSQGGYPYLTIAPTNGMYLLTVFNDQGPANYAIWWTPVLANASYPWTAITAGTTGQTNFLVPVPQFFTGFYRAEWDTNSVPTWIAADPNNPATGPLAVFIDTPANGTVIQ